MQTGFEIDAAAIKRGEKLFRQECHFVTAAAKPADLADSNLPEIAFIGRSNVGKSSLINALTGRNKLARTSSTPGRTQQINFFNLGTALCLVDLPGYGYAKASKKDITAWNQLIHHYLTGRENLERVCLLIDARRGIIDSDREMMDILSNARVPFMIILTKRDKVKKITLEDVTASVMQEIKSYGTGFPGVVTTSAEKRTGIDEFRAILTILAGYAS